MWPVKTICFLMLFLFISACSETNPTNVDDNDSDPGTNDNGNSIVTPTNTNFLPYEVLSPPSNGVITTSALQAVDSANPSSSGIQGIASNGENLQVLRPRFAQGVFSNAMLSDYQLDTLMFTQNNQLFKVDIHDVIEPTSVQLSNEFRANEICHEWDIWANDFMNPDNSRYIYYVHSSDCQAFGGEWHMINLSMDANQSPKILPSDINYFVSSITDTTTGQLNGWLAVNQNGFLVKFDSELVNAEFVSLNNSNIQVDNNVRAARMMNNANGHLLLSVNEKILWYNPLSNVIEHAVDAFSVGQSSRIVYWRSDGSHLYYILNHLLDDGTVTSSALYRIALQTPANVELLIQETNEIVRLEVGSDGAVIATAEVITRYVPSNLLQPIQRIDTPLNYTLSTNVQGLPIFVVVDTMLLVEYALLGSVEDKIVKLMDTRSLLDETLVDNYIVGVKYENSRRFDKSRVVEKIVLENGGIGSSQRELYVLVPSQYPTQLSLGILPQDNNPRLLTRFTAYGHEDILIQGLVNSVAEIFYINLAETSSLVRLTNNQLSERVVNF